jgi:hypothetical protein
MPKGGILYPLVDDELACPFLPRWGAYPAGASSFSEPDSISVLRDSMRTRLRRG